MSAATGRGDGRVRTRARVEGTVQGVGFRPFVYRIAHEEGLVGYVLNDEQGVLLEVEGPAASVSRFVQRLNVEAPPLAAVDRVRCDSVAPHGEPDFRILDSASTGVADALVTPDSATCADCLAELLDPADRRHRYPFINCTNCGPRFTIVRGVPYDRPLTTMAAFEMCPDCRREYEDPLDRRFHAQPNACPRCGPSVRVLGAAGAPVAAGASAAAGAPVAAGAPAAAGGGLDLVAWVAARLAEGAIVAVKGLGGFHLVCDGANERAVATLRARKHREDRPFALMVPDVDAARRLVVLGDPEARLLSSRQRPIVLAPRRGHASVTGSVGGGAPVTGSITPAERVAGSVAPGGPVAASVAPGAPELGVMLPYTPLHHLLIGDFWAASTLPVALVMTSGNASDEPIAFRDEDALARLMPIADLILLHDREIETRTDDSVMRTVRTADGSRPLMLRRSRGYVPEHVRLPVAAQRPLLACGAEQKNTFCVAKGSRAWVGHHIGDLEHYATLEAFQHGIDHFQRLFAVSPRVVAHDLHPDYLSTRYALEREGVECVGVQHHHAHLAACLAEHGLVGPAVGAIFDGTGYGADGTVWGGELLIGGLTGYERAGSLWPVRMPGAAAAIRQPWRMAFSWLAEAFGEPQPLPRSLRERVDPARWAAMGRIGASAAVSPVTSSIGRLFDAVGVLCGAPVEVSYEGQAAVELEGRAWTVAGTGAGAAAGVRPGAAVGADYEIEVRPGPGGLRLDPRAAVRAIASDLERGADPADVAAGFHAGLARATVAALVTLAEAHGLDAAVLSGGVFQNRLLLETVAAGLERADLRALIPGRLPPGDGGISFGQAAVAAAGGAGMAS